jgi:phosphotransferase system enzyme I (PtsP)
MALFGIGFRSVSMSPASIGPVKAMLLGLDAEALGKAMNEALDDTKTPTSIRELLAHFAEAHNIPL